MLPSKTSRIVFCDDVEPSSTLKTTQHYQSQPPTKTMREDRLRHSIERHIQKEFQPAKCIELISGLLKLAGIVVDAKHVWHLGTGGQWEPWTFDELERFAGELLINQPCDLTTTAVTSTKSKILNYFHRPGTECSTEFKDWLIKTIDEIVHSHVNSLVLSPSFSAIIRAAHGTMDYDWFQRQNASEVDHFVCAKQLYKVGSSATGYVPVINRMLQLQTHQTQSLLSTALDGDRANIPVDVSPAMIEELNLTMFDGDKLLALQVSLGSALLGNRIQSHTLIQLSGLGATDVFRSIQMLAGSYGWAPRLQMLANVSNSCDSIRSSFQRLTFFEVAKSDCSTLKRALNSIRSIGVAASTLIIVLTATDLTPIPIDAFRVLSVVIAGPVASSMKSPDVNISLQTPSQLSAASSRYLMWLAKGALQWPKLQELVIDHFVCGSKLREHTIKCVIESFAAKSNWMASKPTCTESIDDSSTMIVTRNQVMLKDIVDPICALASHLGYKSLAITQREIANSLESLEFDTSKTGNRLCVWYYIYAKSEST